MIRCSVVIPVYNGAELADQCVRRIRRDPPAVGHEIVLVDDGSTDGSSGALAGIAGARLVSLPENGGFARACNAGAEAAEGELVVFLNNDTLPRPGWLDALVGHYDAHPNIGAVGSKLLFPNGTVQHAGVTIGQDGFPRHVYAGFPADHPAVSRSRRFKAVTAACMLVERERFLALGGFDTAYRNGMEDVDLCLRFGVAGLEVHFCAESVLVHYESVTRGRGTAEISEGIRRFRERWREHAQPDDIAVWRDDGLIRVRYEESYPIELEVAPELATVAGERGTELDRRLRERSRQAADLLRDLVELSARLAGVPLPSESAPPRPRLHETLGLDHAEIGRRIDAIGAAIHELQLLLSVAAPAGGALPTTQLTHRAAVRRVTEAVRQVVPEGDTVVVISRGEDGLLDLGRRTGWHFPRSPEGGFAGHYPADDAEAIRHLEELRGQGAGHLVVPEGARWWLGHYEGFGRHLNERYDRTTSEDCVIYSLSPRRAHVTVR